MQKLLVASPQKLSNKTGGQASSQPKEDAEADQVDLEDDSEELNAHTSAGKS